MRNTIRFLQRCTVATLLSFTCVWAANATVELYDRDENKVYYSENGSMSVSSGNGSIACLTDDSETCYRCSATMSGSEYVAPNGSYFTKDGVTYMCTISGIWTPCIPTSNNRDLQNYFQLYHKENNNWRVYSIPEDLNIDQISLQGTATFCQMPDAWLINTNTYLNYYSADSVYCEEGYYADGTDCTSCPSVANGSSTTSGFSSATKCNITCNSGYTSNGSTCVSGSDKSYNTEGDCGYGYFDNGYYYGDSGDCYDCPDNAKCDGFQFYCYAGYYGVAPDDGTTPYCVKCPMNGNLDNASPDGDFGWDEDAEMLYSCTGDYAGYMKGIETDCLYNDDWTDTEDPYYACQAYYGADKTGKYRFGNENTGNDHDGGNYCFYGN